MDDAAGLKVLEMQFFSGFQQSTIDEDLVIPNFFPIVDVADLCVLEKGIEYNEVKDSFFSIGGLQAPRVDGCPRFYLLELIGGEGV